MSTTHSPLRYPGGKSILTPLVQNILNSNNLQRCHYVEPFAGGAGLALSLLLSKSVCHLHLNDIDPSIYSFWHSVLEHTEDFISRIRSADVTVEQWHKHRVNLINENLDDPVSLGFSAFFLNRTSRSGIIKASGVIGGYEQKGNYKIDCRFNKEALIAKIRRISCYRTQISISNLDASNYLEKYCSNLPKDSFIYSDPPYFDKGPELYLNSYKENDHHTLSKSIKQLEVPWMLTYDCNDIISSYYRDFTLFQYNLRYSVQRKKHGREFLILPNYLNYDFGDAEQKFNVKQVKSIGE